MPTWLDRVKPRASRRQQLFLAAAMWSTLGGMLLFFGSRWILQGAAGPEGAGLLVLAVILGSIKGWFVLDKAARRITTRIGERGDGRCLGGFLSWKSWLLIAVMSLSGRFLRGSHLPPAVLGTLYAAIGTGLVFSSRIAWRRWGATDGP